MIFIFFSIYSSEGWWAQVPFHGFKAQNEGEIKETKFDQKAIMRRKRDRSC